MMLCCFFILGKKGGEKYVDGYNYYQLVIYVVAVKISRGECAEIVICARKIKNMTRNHNLKAKNTL